MKTIKDLIFEPEFPNNGFSKQAVLEFDNGYGVSVLLGGYGVYSNGIDTYELAILLNGEIYHESDIISEGVVGYVDKEELSDYIRRIQELPKHE